MNRLLKSLVIAAFSAFAASAFAADEPKSVSPYVPSPDSVVSDLLKLASVGPKDFVIDLGSGDGRIVLTAAKVFGASGFGVEILDNLVKLSNETAAKEGLADRVKFMKQDLFQTDISQASVLTMYLLPDIVNRLKDKLLAELKPGTRILSHDYALAGWIPERVVEMDLQEKVKISGVTTTILYLYLVPAKLEGGWSAKVPGALSREPVALSLKQQITRISGNARVGGREVPIEEGRIAGDKVDFRLTVNGRPHAFTGVAKGKTIEGTVDGAPWTASLVK